MATCGWRGHSSPTDRHKTEMATDILKKIYEGEGKLAFFFEQATPVDLYRRRNIGDKTMIMQPTIIGFGPE